LLTPDAIDVLLEHDWQGNVRELANVMEHAYIIAGGGPILPEHLPHTVSQPSSLTPSLNLAPGTAPPRQASSAARTLEEIEMEHVLRVLEKHGGSKTAAAQELGISLKTMYNKLNRLQEQRKSAG
jgi:DNA-binding NtrC family response regulator